MTDTPKATPQFASMNGKVVPFADAVMHVTTPAAAYGAAVFEGIRVYAHPDSGRQYVLKLTEHCDRLRRSMRLMRFDQDYATTDLVAWTLDAIRANRLAGDLYIRQLAFIDGQGAMGATGPVSLAITVVQRTRTEAAVNGLSCGVSSWTRIADNASPARIKAVANYHNGRLAVMEARRNGFDAAIMLTAQGKVAEAPGACLFIVRDGVPVTSSVNSDILESITRAAVLELYREMAGQPGQERTIDRTELYLAEEAFLCGTGQEVAPVLAFDKLAVGDGRIGPITSRLRDRYVAVARGLTEDHAGWRTAVA